MAVNALKPKFGDKEGYRAWINSWKIVYGELSRRIRLRKLEIKNLMKAPPADISEGHEWQSGRGCHVCGKSHGTRHYFEVCSPRSQVRKAYLEGSVERIAAGAKLQKELHLMRRDATKMMTLLKEAKLRRDRIRAMEEQVANQGFPLELTASVVDVHFNRGSNEFPSLPKWVVKAKGKIFYVDHIDATVPWSTRELDSGSTKGMLRFRKCRVAICEERIANITAS